MSSSSVVIIACRRPRPFHLFVYLGKARPLALPFHVHEHELVNLLAANRDPERLAEALGGANEEVFS